MWYDTEEKERRRSPKACRLRPDVCLEVTDRHDNAPKRFTFAIDAKYRNYPGYYYRKERELHGVDTVFDLDLLITAKEKYYERLGCDAAFVIHSDCNKNYEDWGGGSSKQNSWPRPEHHYGAVFSNPSNTQNLRKLLKCFLMYHMDIKNICWSCRSEIEERNVLSKSNWVEEEQYDELGHRIGTHKKDNGRQPVGYDYLCNQCQHSWTRTWCMNTDIDLEDRKREHRILKIGNDIFHDKSIKGCICPSCGNGTQKQ